MGKSRFTEEQIIGMIREHEAGPPTKDICRMHGLNTARYYKSKAKYGGMEVSGARKLNRLLVEGFRDRLQREHGSFCRDPWGVRRA